MLVKCSDVLVLKSAYVCRGELWFEHFDVFICMSISGDNVLYLSATLVADVSDL